MKRKIMACILAAALGITGVSFPAAAKTVSVGKNITVNVKNPLDELRAQEAAMQQQEELEE